MSEYVLAIDPGTTESAWLLYNASLGRPELKAIESNRDVLALLREPKWSGVNERLAIEMVAHYGTGMPAGREVFETCLWIGRYLEAWAAHHLEGALVYRKDIKLLLCGNSRAKDPHVRQALIDKLGAPGTKKAPGRTYGVSSHLWSALAVAVTYAETVLKIQAPPGSGAFLEAA